MAWQLSNALFAMVVTLAGMVTNRSLVQLLNAFLPIVVSSSGKETQLGRFENRYGERLLPRVREVHQELINEIRKTPDRTAIGCFILCTDFGTGREKIKNFFKKLRQVETN